MKNNLGEYLEGRMNLRTLALHLALTVHEIT